MRGGVMSNRDDWTTRAERCKASMCALLISVGGNHESFTVENLNRMSIADVIEALYANGCEVVSYMTSKKAMEIEKSIDYYGDK